MQKKPKILLWDIEASDLAANFGFIYCISYKWLDSKRVHTISIRDFPRFKKKCNDDTDVIKAFTAVMAEADMQVTWYGSRFDYPYVQTKIMMHRLKPLSPVPHLDLWRVARYRLKFNSNRLETVSMAIPSTGDHRELKTRLDPAHWMDAKAGYIKSLRYIEKHCVADVKVLDDVYHWLKKFAPQTVPNLSKFGGVKEEGCPACGSYNFQCCGYHLTARGNKQKAQCKDCGHWFILPLLFRKSREAA